MFHLKDGQSLQEAVAQFERPDAQFFADLRLPSFIPRTEARFGLGRSEIVGTVWEDKPNPGLLGAAGKSKIPARPKKKK